MAHVGVAPRRVLVDHRMRAVYIEDETERERDALEREAHDRAAREAERALVEPKPVGPLPGVFYGQVM